MITPTKAINESIVSTEYGKEDRIFKRDRLLEEEGADALVADSQLLAILVRSNFASDTGIPSRALRIVVSWSLV
jgi:hypothetical protein